MVHVILHPMTCRGSPCVVLSSDCVSVSSAVIIQHAPHVDAHYVFAPIHVQLQSEIRSQTVLIILSRWSFNSSILVSPRWLKIKQLLSVSYFHWFSLSVMVYAVRLSASPFWKPLLLQFLSHILREKRNPKKSLFDLHCHFLILTFVVLSRLGSFLSEFFVIL